ncbi:GIY-YIG nuclease family protein [Georgenia satyanarayanai]|uniref:GIY-YIG nuclease family protein n=1 Tax=Georgenia satyanarayanai TaxID=860221 RepID=UPI001264F7B8|nr:GIY-YIG nuclease family protein [Georgenia satyanarayanai]
MDRVNELGDASVPFRFDVHTMYFSTDAVSLEAALHAHFANRRLNKVNLRREFFYATPTEVLDVLKQHAGAVTEYTETAEAEEFRLSRGELADAF